MQKAFKKKEWYYDWTHFPLILLDMKKQDYYQLKEFLKLGIQ